MFVNRLVDDLKEQTGVDITFFYQESAVMTSICNENGVRWIGMQAGENIRQFTLEQGAQLWYRNIEIDKKLCHAYIIPILQPSSGTVTGALMASISTSGLGTMMKRYIIISAIASAAILIAVAAFIFFYIGGLTKVLHDVRHVLLQVSEGNFADKRLIGIHRKDEFGELAIGTEKLRTKIENLFDDIQAGMLKLTDAAEKLSGTLTQTVSAAREMNESVDQINITANNQKSGTQNATENVERTRNAIDFMLKQISDINLLSNNMAQLAANSKTILRELLESSQNSQEAVQEISQQVSVTNESVQQIKSVTEYITNIAEETTLLSLNASIEAARAGESGKGFAVVALEIQKLAEESNTSAAKIGDNIRSLVEKTNGIVTVMETIEKTLKEQENNVAKTTQLFDEINEDILRVTRKEADMQNSVSDMNQAKDNMSAIISGLSESAVNNADLSKNAAKVTSQMMCEIENLDTLTTDLSELANQLDDNLKAFLA